MVKRIQEDSDSDSAPEEVGISKNKSQFDTQNKQVLNKSVKKSNTRKRKQSNKSKNEAKIEDEDLERILATKLDDKAFEKLQNILDKFGQSKSQKIKETLENKRKLFAASKLKEKKRNVPLTLKKNPLTKFIIDNKKTRKIIPKAKKSIEEFKTQQFYGDRVNRTSLSSMLNKK